MPRDVAAVVTWCRQADRQGLLSGDVCRCRQIAAVVSERFSNEARHAESRALMDKLDDIFETWLMLEHPKAYETFERTRAGVPDPGSIGTDDEGFITSQTMADMISKIRAGRL